MKNILFTLCFIISLSSYAEIRGFNKLKRIIKRAVKVIDYPNNAYPKIKGAKTLNKGDSTKSIRHGDLLSIDKNSKICTARRNIDNELLFDCVSNSDFIADIKMPCMYKEKLYLHGDLIPVDPGVWIYYRGEVLPIRRGTMLLCHDGDLKVIRIPRYSLN